MYFHLLTDVLSKPSAGRGGAEKEIGSRPGKCWKQGLHGSPKLEPDSKEFKAGFPVEESTE